VPETTEVTKEFSLKAIPYKPVDLRTKDLYILLRSSSAFTVTAKVLATDPAVKPL